MKMHLGSKSFHFAAVPWIRQIRQRQGNRPNILSVHIEFWRSINTWIGDFEGEQRCQWFSLNREFESGASLILLIKTDRIGGKRSCDGSKIFNILWRGMQCRR